MTQDTGRKLTLDEILDEVESGNYTAGIEAEEKKNGEESSADGTESAEELPPGTSAGSFSLQNILSAHPELLQELPEILKAIRGLAGVLQVPAVGDGKSTEKTVASPVPLLTALRPYLSQNRRRAVDALLNMTKLGETFRSFH